MDSVLRVLPNGLRVVTSRMPSVESVAVGVWVGVGGRHEPAGLSGISHFIEHLLFKGTRTRSAAAISRAIEGRGGDFNAYTQEDATCYYIRMAAPQGPAAFDILVDMVRHPRFAPADVKGERDIICDEIAMYRDQPAQVAEDRLGELLWPDHPLGRPLVGTDETLKRIGRPELVRFRNACYVPAATVVSVAGQVDHDRWFQRVVKAFQDLPRQPIPPCAPASEAGAPRRVGLVAKDTEQAHLALGFRIFGREDARRHAMKVLSVVLGENMSSRLFQVIREKHGLAYAIQSTTSHFADTGALTVTAGVDPADIRRALELVCRELRRMADRPVGPRELRRAKDYVTGQVKLGLESSGRQMNWAGEAVSAYGRVIPPEEVIAAIDSVEPAAVQALAQSLLDPARASLAVVAPGLDERQARELEERLASHLNPEP